uniref:Uncharacterized protein n=1 Tax=Homalodisca liturata TaxID=320908 RepID=A0A1B6JI69_9HEMI
MPDYISVTLTHKETIVKNTPCVKNNLCDLITQLKNIQKNVNEHLTDLVNSSGTENTSDSCCEDDEDDDENEEDVNEKVTHHKRRKLERETSSPKKLKNV